MHANVERGPVGVKVQISQQVIVNISIIHDLDFLKIIDYVQLFSQKGG